MSQTPADRKDAALPDPDDKLMQIIGRNDAGPAQMGEDTVDEAKVEPPANDEPQQDR